MEDLLVSKVYVLHVKHGYEERLFSINQQFKRRGIEFELILDGDMEDISQKHLDDYFSGEMHKITPGTSCALKHFLIYENIVKNNLPNALVFEDDILLTDNFNAVFNLTIAEAKNRSDIDDSMTFISYENSTLKSINRSQLIDGQFLYEATNTRCTGAYYLTNEVASLFLNMAKSKKCYLSIDWFHKNILQENHIPILWCHPPIAEQGSHNGRFRSGIDEKKFGLFRQFSWNLLKTYKSIVYKLK